VARYLTILLASYVDAGEDPTFHFRADLDLDPICWSGFLKYFFSHHS
jgi:hypothetical protein